MFDEYVTTSCANCGVKFGVPQAWHKARHEDGKTFYCPNGHQLHFGDSKVDLLQKRLDRVSEHSTWLSREKAAIERRHIAAKGQITKLRKKLAT